MAWCRSRSCPCCRPARRVELSPASPPKALRAQLSPREVEERTGQIRLRVLARSKHITAAQFEAIADEDLALLFGLYDELFFQGGLRGALRGPLTLRLSKRMTRNGGKTILRRIGDEVSYEIVLSSTLLFQSFRDVERTIKVNGLICGDRLDALMRVFEHELVHLLEFIRWGASSCREAPFQRLAHDLFGHSDHFHQLVTQAERARVCHAIAVGDRVCFWLHDERLTGRVERITRRATVRVSADRKFYVPLRLLERAPRAVESN
ncbi:SprT-like family protein [Myxococcota bacterium]|nr:SprT-like family protein [Myxococcota bacterium]MBU1433065.1 SprT-like family protein [Myxococcota bacterium]MBU1898200.1 SprT-like family protein [Myxococcota bacterium]